MELSSLLTLFVSILVGAVLPLQFRRRNHDELLSMINLRKNCEPYASEGDLNDIENAIKSSLSSFKDKRKSAKRYDFALAAIVGVAVVAIALAAVYDAFPSNNGAASNNHQYAQQQDQSGDPAADGDLEQSVDAHPASLNTGTIIVPDVSQLLSFLSVLVATVAAAGAMASAIISRKVYLSQTRPEVIVYIEYDRTKGTILLWVKNIGSGVAYDVAFDIGELPGLDEFDKGFIDRLNGDGIRMLAPGSSISSIVGDASSPEFAEYNYVVCVSSSYYGSTGKKGVKYEGEFALDYGAFLEPTYTDSEQRQTRMAVEAIRKELEKSASAIKSSIASLKR